MILEALLIITCSLITAIVMYITGYGKGVSDGYDRGFQDGNVQGVIRAAYIIEQRATDMLEYQHVDIEKAHEFILQEATRDDLLEILEEAKRQEQYELCQRIKDELELR
jgi:hypothetical protein